MNDILEYSDLVYSVANKYFKNYSNRDDLYQVGMIGLIKAYNNYKPNSNCKFSTYAYNYIYGEMSLLVRQDKTIKVSKQISSLNSKIERAYVLLTQKLMKEPSISEIAYYLGIDEYYVSEALNSINKVASINENINYDNDLTLEDIIGYRENYEDRIYLDQQLSKLTKEELQLIKNRYLNDLTQSETSKIMNMSQVQVSRNEQKILKKLRKSMQAA